MTDQWDDKAREIAAKLRARATKARQFAHGRQFTGSDIALCDDASEYLEYYASADQAAAQAWRPIETAPKDGTPVLIRCFVLSGEFRSAMTAVCWREGDNPWSGGPAAVPGFLATDWQPLPPPPEPQG